LKFSIQIKIFSSFKDINKLKNTRAKTQITKILVIARYVIKCHTIYRIHNSPITLYKCFLVYKRAMTSFKYNIVIFNMTHWLFTINQAISHAAYAFYIALILNFAILMQSHSILAILYFLSISILDVLKANINRIEPIIFFKHFLWWLFRGHKC